MSIYSYQMTAGILILSLIMIGFSSVRIHMELQQFSSQFFRQNQIQMQLHCSQLLIDWQQQCSFVLQVNFQMIFPNRSIAS